MNLRATLILITLTAAGSVFGCTSAIVGRGASKSGHILLWKHRDTSHSNNYVDTVRGSDPRYDYVALFNSSDSLKKEAWAGANRAGFAIFNTVAGNLPANSKECIDREGIVMTLALSKCVTVDDFECLLDTLPRPLGVRTNFGVADAKGNAAYFETDDVKYRKYTLDSEEDGLMVRSNFSFSGSKKGGYGYERFNTASALLQPLARSAAITPETFTEQLSRCYLHPTKGDMLTASKAFIKDNNYIPRPSSASSIVIELTPGGPVMWTMLGYPPASYAIPATVDSVAPELKRDPATGLNRIAEESNRKKREILSQGKINVSVARQIAEHMGAVSRENYRLFRKNTTCDRGR